MSYDVLLGIGDARLAAQTRALLEEGGEVVVAETLTNAGDVLASLDEQRTECVVLHEDLGPLPVLDLTREIASRHPDTGVVLLVKEATPEVYRGALAAGARGLATLPLSLEELHTSVTAAAAWSRSVRNRLHGEMAEMNEPSGTMIAIAGAKGGVGTTTVAVQLALQAARAGGRKVCLVDFDLQGGDVPNLLDLTHRRSVLDLVEVAHELTARQLDESLYLHREGFRVLLAPPEGERGEDVTARAARQILGGIRSRFDIVIVDCGSTVSEPAAVAVEMADRALVVATSDVPALRAANRLLRMWERLQVRKPQDVEVLLNRTSRDRVVQPDVARKVLDAALTETFVPAAFKELEVATNTGVPERLDDGAVSRAIKALAVELELVSPPRRRRSILSGDSGQVAVETLGLTALIAIVVLLLWQTVLAGYTFVLAGHAAREGARQHAVGSDAEDAAEKDLPGPWRDGARVRTGDDWVEVRLSVPLAIPGIDSPIRIASRAGTVKEGS